MRVVEWASEITALMKVPHSQGREDVGIERLKFETTVTNSSGTVQRTLTLSALGRRWLALA